MVKASFEPKVLAHTWATFYSSYLPVVKGVDSAADRISDWSVSLHVTTGICKHWTVNGNPHLLLNSVSNVLFAVIGPVDPETCHPECTREYCRNHPSGLCSARWAVLISLLCHGDFPKLRSNGILFSWLRRLVSLEKKSCQGSCQHVSCSSCLLIKPPPCPHTCSASDSTCLQRFGKCVHHHLSHSPVCHNNLQVGVRKTGVTADTEELC